MLSNTINAIALAIASEMITNKLSKAHITDKDLLKAFRAEHITSYYLLELKNNLEQLGIGFLESKAGIYLLIDIGGIGKGSRLILKEVKNNENFLQNIIHQLSEKTTKKLESISLIEKVTEVWLLLCETAQNKETISPKELMQKTQQGFFTHHRQVEKPLKIIKFLCEKYNYPLLHLLVVHDSAKLRQYQVQQRESELKEVYENINSQTPIKIDEDEIYDLLKKGGQSKN